MKQLLIALIALTLTLGVACKKSNHVADSKPSTELIKKADVKPPVQVMTIEKDPISSGADAWPHNTGSCMCGRFGVCHPKTWVDSQGMGHLTMPGQTTFPPGASFPGNY